MFRPQSYFSNVPCPLLFGPGEDIGSRKCELVYCLFSHDVGDNAMSTSRLQAQQSHAPIQQQPQLLPQTHQELSSKLNNKSVHAQIHGGIRTPSGESVSSGSTGGVTLEEIELDLNSNTSDGNSSGSGSEDLRVARERGRERGIRVKRRKMDIGGDNDDDNDEDDNGVCGRITRGKKGSELLKGKKKRNGDRGAGVGLQVEHEEEDSDEMEIEVEVEGVQLGKGDIPGLQEQHSKGKTPVPASTLAPTVVSRGILQKQKQQIRDQQERMASVPGVTSTGGKPKSPAIKQSTTPQGKVDDGIGASTGFITRGMTTVPKAPPGSMISSSATTNPLSPALTYSTKPNSSTAAPGTVSKSTNTPTTTTTTALAKPVLLVPAVVARCPAKWGTRQQLLTLLHGEYVRLYQATQQDPMVITMTVDEEAEIARTKGSVYPNVMKNRITALKKADVKSAEWVDKRKELAGKRKGELRKELEELAGVKNREVGAAGGKGQFSGLGVTSSGVGKSASVSTSAPPTMSETGTPTGTTTPKAASTPTPLVVHSDLITDPTLYKPVVTGLSPEEEIARLPPLLHPLAMLTKYGHIIKPPSESDIAIAESGVAASLGWEICERCDSRFQIFPGRRESDGALASGGKCVFHWGRALLPPRSIASVGLGAAERTYTCCKESVGTSAGCVTGESHVFKVGDVKRLASQWQWVETYPSRDAQEGDPDALNGAEATAVPQVKITRAFGLDCEMCYTTLGMEMVRLTMVDFPRGKIVLDALVRPKGDILDLNSRFSGVSAKEYISAKPFSLTSFRNASTSLMIFPSPEAARDQVLQILRFGIEGAVARNSQADHMDIDNDLEVDQGVTALIGHALENDLSVLRLCHPYIIDTCILFPHSKGFPLRNKLAWIAERYLKWRIQAQDIVSVGEGGESGLIKGHDSAIDARCAGELVRWRIKEGVAREKVGRGSAVGGSAVGGSKGGRSLKTFGGGGGLRFDGVAGYIAREKEERDKEEEKEKEKEVGVPLPHSQQQNAFPSSKSFPFNTTTSSSQLHGSNSTPGLSPQQSQSPRSQKQQQKRKRGVFTESDGEEGGGKDSKVTAGSGGGGIS